MFRQIQITMLVVSLWYPRDISQYIPIYWVNHHRIRISANSIWIKQNLLMISVYIIIYHYISLHIIIYHYISLYVIIYIYVSLYIIVNHYIYIYIYIYISVYHCKSLYISVYHCIPVVPHKAVAEVSKIGNL